MRNMTFSVAMCVYGRDNPDWFETAVNSILNQTVTPNEVVLVVDGPVPTELDNVIKKYNNDDLFHVLRFPENQGHGNARRAGLNACTNELVALMDADDVSSHDRFEKQLSLFEKDKSLDIVGGNIIEFTDDENNIVARRLVPSNDVEIKKYLKKRCPMNQVTVMFKKSSVEKVGGYIDWYCNEDYYLWLRMAKAHMKFANLPEILVYVRVGADMYQRRGGKEYFQSEKKLQDYMLKNKIINRGTYCMNVIKRWIVQVVLPNSVRGWIYRTFARTQ